MSPIRTRFVSLLLLIALPTTAADIISDAGVGIDATEFQAILDTVPREILEKAAHDTGDRFELINQLMIARKLAAQSDALTPEHPGYWPLQFAIVEAKRKLRFDQLVEEMMQIDEQLLTDLARERYATLKDKFAKVPETRASSHILLLSAPGLDRTALREKAAGLLAELRAGASFSEYVEKYSEDPGSKRRAGSLNRWIEFGQPEITPPYSEALYAIENVGEYSEVTDSPFGLHIIRLDGIRPSRYLEFDEVKDAILESIAAERLKLTSRTVRAQLSLSDEAFIDGAAMEAIFAPYK